MLLVASLVFLYVRLATLGPALAAPDLAVVAGFERVDVVEIDPIAARKTLEAISVISRAALNDLRRLLKRIRTESEPAMYAPIASTADSVSAGDGR